MLGSDLLLHPAYSENTGTVIVEALVHGLPVIASAVCGFSTHIRASKGGLVMEEPFVQEAFDQTVLSLLSDAPRRNEMRRAGSDYGVSQDLYSCHQRAVDVLETIAT
jgi:UDP-glucose:(heptosyl)LPS alpha-1,3-glucosyltransferase